MVYWQLPVIQWSSCHRKKLVNFDPIGMIIAGVSIGDPAANGAVASALVRRP